MVLNLNSMIYYHWIRQNDSEWRWFVSLGYVTVYYWKYIYSIIIFNYIVKLGSLVGINRLRIILLGVLLSETVDNHNFWITFCWFFSLVSKSDATLIK